MFNVQFLIVLPPIEENFKDHLCQLSILLSLFNDPQSAAVHSPLKNNNEHVPQYHIFCDMTTVASSIYYDCVITNEYCITGKRTTKTLATLCSNN